MPCSRLANQDCVGAIPAAPLIALAHAWRSESNSRRIWYARCEHPDSSPESRPTLQEAVDTASCAPTTAAEVAVAPVAFVARLRVAVAADSDCCAADSDRCVEVSCVAIALNCDCSGATRDS